MRASRFDFVWRKRENRNLSEDPVPGGPPSWQDWDPHRPSMKRACSVFVRVDSLTVRHFFSSDRQAASCVSSMPCCASRGARFMGLCCVSSRHRAHRRRPVNVVGRTCACLSCLAASAGACGASDELSACAELGSLAPGSVAVHPRGKCMILLGCAAVSSSRQYRDHTSRN